MKALSIFVVSVLWSVRPCVADVLVDQQPYRYGGGASDTLFLDPLGAPWSQLIADDFVLGADEPLVSLRFWGFYNADNPPPSETIRVRLYDARLEDGMPRNIVFEQTFQNPSRAATGRIVLTGISPHEYVYDVSFSEPIRLPEGSAFWLEVVQLGDLSTCFRWEESVGGNHLLAFLNSDFRDWRLAAPDAAFQLVSPEPASLLTLCSGVTVLARRRGRFKEGRWSTLMIVVK